MIAYYLRLAIRRLKGNATAYAVVALVLGAGVGCTMVMGSIVRQINHDPAPGRSSQLYRPVIDARPEAQRRAGGEGGANLTWPDAQQLMRQGARWPQVALAGGRVVAKDAADQAFNVRARYATEQIFQVLGVELASGRGWSKAEGDAAQRLVVVSSTLAERLCAENTCRGATVDLDGHAYRVIGVAAPWHPVPMYHADLPGAAFAEADQLFLPLAAAVADDMIVDGSVSVWGESGEKPRLGGSMAWLQLWALLPHAEDLDPYRQMVVAHARSRGLSAEHDIVWAMPDWLRQQGLVAQDTRVQLWLCYLLLAVCVTNAGAMLYLTLDRRRHEMAIRRAVGARRIDVLVQMLLEATVVGLLSGTIATAVYLGGLQFVQSSRLVAAALTAPQASTALLALLIGLVVALACAAIPALRLCTRKVVVQQIAASP